MPNDLTTLIFLHSFKTAGTTLRHILSRQYPEQARYTFYRSQNPTPLEQLTLEERQRIRLCSSHEPLGTHDHYLTPPIHYLTMLRDPVDRVISEHYYRLYKGLQGAQGHMPLITVSEQMKVGHQDNLQVRMISGQGAMGEVAQATLEQASENLFAPFMTFGLVDRFTESLLLFSEKFGWQGLPIGLNFNRTPRKNEHSVDSQTRRAIAEHHSFDVQLVDLARSHFALRLREAEITPAAVAKFSNHWTTKARTFSFLSTLAARRSFRTIKGLLKLAP